MDDISIDAPEFDFGSKEEVSQVPKELETPVPARTPTPPPLLGKGYFLTYFEPYSLNTLKLKFKSEVILLKKK